MSQNVSLRLPDEVISRLDRFARMLGNGTTRSRAGQILLDEALREEEITGIEFRNTVIGRQPFVKHTGLTVWEMIMTAKRYDLDSTLTAANLHHSIESVQSALNYYSVYGEEVDHAIEDNNIGYEAMKRQLPNLRLFTVPKQDENQESQS